MKSTILLFSLCAAANAFPNDHDLQSSQNYPEFGRIPLDEDLFEAESELLSRELEVAMSMSMSMSLSMSYEYQTPTVPTSNPPTQSPVENPSGTLAPVPTDSNATASPAPTPVPVPTDPQPESGHSNQPTSAPTNINTNTNTNNSSDGNIDSSDPPPSNDCSALPVGGTVEVLLEVDSAGPTWSTENVAAVLAASLREQIPSCTIAQNRQLVTSDIMYRMGEVTIEDEDEAGCLPQSDEATSCTVVKASVQVYGDFETDNAAEVTSSVGQVVDSDEAFAAELENEGITDVRFYQERDEVGVQGVRSTDSSNQARSTVVAVLSATAGSVVLAIAARRMMKSRGAPVDKLADASTAQFAEV